MTAAYYLRLLTLVKVKSVAVSYFSFKGFAKEEFPMAESKTPAKAQPESAQPPARVRERDFLGSLRDEVERVFEDFDRSMWGLPAR